MRLHVPLPSPLCTQLVTIMDDQVETYGDALSRSVMIVDQTRTSYDEAFSGRPSLLYITADKAVSCKEDLFRLQAQGRLSMLVVDEYHSTMDKLSFRVDSYGKLPDVVKHIAGTTPHVPVVLMSGSSPRVWVQHPERE